MLIHVTIAILFSECLVARGLSLKEIPLDPRQGVLHGFIYMVLRAGYEPIFCY